MLSRSTTLLQLIRIMEREEEIRVTALEYVCRSYSNIDDAVDDAFVDGALWSDSHPANPWHSVADGDLPTELKGDCVDMPFIVVCKDGITYSAYYDIEEDEENYCFYDDCGCVLDVDYWLEIPQLPKESEARQ